MEGYKCPQFNDDSVNFIFTRVFETPIPVQNGRGLDYWFTEASKIAKLYNDDNCKTMISSLHWDQNKWSNSNSLKLLKTN